MSWRCKKCGHISRGDSKPDVCPNFVCKNDNVAMWEYLEDNPNAEHHNISGQKPLDGPNHYNEQPLDPNEEQYRSAQKLYSGKTTEELRQAKALFFSLGDYKDAASMSVKCDRKLEKLYEADAKKRYQLAKTYYEGKNSIEHLTKAKQLWESIPGYKDSNVMAIKCERQINKLVNPRKNIGAIIAVIAIAAAVIIAVVILFMSGILNGGSSHNDTSSSSASGGNIEDKSSAKVKKINVKYGDLDGRYYIDAFGEYCEISGSNLIFYRESGGETKTTYWIIDFSQPTLTIERYDGKMKEEMVVYEDGSLDLIDDDGSTVTLEKK